MGETDRAARVGISPEREFELDPAIGRTHARNAGGSEMSRHLANPTRFDIRFHFMQNVIQLPACDVALHLLVPLIVFPPVQPGGQLSALLERQLHNGILDFRETHSANPTIDHRFSQDARPVESLFKPTIRLAAASGWMVTRRGG